jgi:hypothetical protein
MVSACDKRSRTFRDPAAMDAPRDCPHREQQIHIDRF